MPRVKAKPKPKAKTNSAPRTTVQETPAPISQDVLTLSEAAAYLRLPEPVVTDLVLGQGLPGRFAGTEWRFLKSAIQDWLRTPLPRPSKEAQMAVAGAWKDDPSIDEMLREIYKQRGRPMTEDGE